METLFGYLATRISPNQENLATEALCYILQAESARAAFQRLLSQYDRDLPSLCEIVTQDAEKDGGVADLVGKDAAGRKVFIGEAKFWVGLTEMQPTGYAERLQSAGGGLLLFVLPRRRLETVWHEVTSRCYRAGMVPRELQAEGLRIGSLPGGVTLGAVTWDGILSTLISALEIAGKSALASDARQLQGLCERMDEEAFLPLHSEEITGSTATRILQYRQLIVDLVNRLIHHGAAERKGLNPTGWFGGFGHYFRLHGFGSLLAFDAERWRKYGVSPIWLGVTGLTEEGQKWKSDPRVAETLRTAFSTRSASHHLDRQGYYWVPVELPIGVEREEVLTTALKQLVAVADALVQLNQLHSST